MEYFTALILKKFLNMYGLSVPKHIKILLLKRTETKYTNNCLVLLKCMDGK